MSRFLSKRFSSLVPYVPGEQPRDRSYIKLNTNESPFPPSPAVIRAATEAAQRAMLYPDPDMKELREAFSDLYGVDPDEVVFTNGSDDILNFAAMCFCSDERPAVFPDVTYGLYKVLCGMNGIPYEEIPLRNDFTVDVSDYLRPGRTVFLANPNAPTGILLEPVEIERILNADPARIVVVDEAYVDFGGKSMIPYIKKYPNLFVTGTFSKYRSLAGARLGYGVGNRELIRDIDLIRYSTNPYNVNVMSMACGIAALKDPGYDRKNGDIIIENRERLISAMKEMGFVLTDSKANFVFARHPFVSGEKIYEELRARGILVRHFGGERIKDYNRITIGTAEQTDKLIEALKEILS